jgi:hypothetical protein
MRQSQRYFAVPVDKVPAYAGSDDHTVFVEDDDGVGWAEASSQRPVTGTFAVVGTSRETDGDPGTTWIGTPGDPWPKPPPKAIVGETLESYIARHAPTTVAEPPSM